MRSGETAAVRLLVCVGEAGRVLAQCDRSVAAPLTQSGVTRVVPPSFAAAHKHLGG